MFFIILTHFFLNFKAFIHIYLTWLSEKVLHLSKKCAIMSLSIPFAKETAHGRYGIPQLCPICL